MSTLKQLAQEMRALAEKLETSADVPSAEQYGGSYSGPDGKTVEFWLLPGEASSLPWPNALQWAKDQDGDLPNRIEALLLFQHHRDEFQRELYWTNEQHPDDSSYAWSQSFYDGAQLYWRQDAKTMARAVRRVTG